MPRYRQTHCYAPGCQTGYVFVKGGQKLSLFGVPKDKNRRKEWEKNLHRADKPLEDTSAVCELHFELRYVLRDYVHIIEGKEVRIPRGRPILRADAVPTILPNLPAYLSKKPTQERTARKRKRSEASDVPLQPAFCPFDNSVSGPFAHTDDAVYAGCEECPQASTSSPSEDTNRFYFSLEVPSSYWSRHSFPGHAGVVYCTAVLTSNAEVLSEKVVMFSESQCAAYCKVLARGVLIKEGPVHSKTEAEDELRKTDRMQLCAGAMRRDEYDEALFTTKLRDHVLMRQGVYFSTKCLGQVPKQGNHHSLFLIMTHHAVSVVEAVHCYAFMSLSGMLCVSCRYLRRALLTRRSRVQRRNTKTRLNIAQKLKTAVRRTKRLSTRLYDARESLVKLQQQAAAKNADVLQEQNGSLPIHQQEAVKHCFAAAKVKPNGLRYSKSWLLDCIIMKMKGPRLYEHMRKNKILALPSKSTLKRYISIYRTLFGFNEKILEKLKSKTEELDVSKRHGGLLIDELKLSESLAVRNSGTIEGFVDLGPFTTQKDMSTPSDHGMVVLFVPFQGKWSQVIGCFATNSNMKADILAKVVVEATILAEKSGLFVDFITTNGASWNRIFWGVVHRPFRRGVVSGKIRCGLNKYGACQYAKSTPLPTSTKQKIEKR